ncbi:lysophospholipid acyltransferase family protein [Aliifodinibius sp. S!AR15-10]|uniref:lysophospholipid acyltransferase family protein n=1 Tax=Aliifodinibius sp. S!AR15-10 TaxID=2950437 RepID=UPI0028604AF4|nr:lysophospholipid acyltransferase family protein [Aliifodinibius sp. S!AR15-10]MDR8391822.1 lysophospholipid acyltransferase family protein [Aliifodinibius sp. S!AR15-10]
MEFIPAKESTWFIRIFKWYTWLLFKRRFSRVWLRQDYKPGKKSKTIYFLNHNSWWDGLIPLLLNEFRLKQQARALMEDRQMEQYRFFQKIGAFSINRNYPRKAVTSMRYAVQSMQRNNACLFVYPEGKITPVGSKLQFEGGLAWIYSKVRDLDVDIVPIAIHIQTIRKDKPELHLHVGEAVEVPGTLNNKKRTQLLQEKLQSLLNDLRSTAGFDDSGYERFL